MPTQDPISGSSIWGLLVAHLDPLDIYVSNTLQLALQAVVERLRVILMLRGVIRTLDEIFFALDRWEVRSP